MGNIRLTESAEHDFEARGALWRAICVASHDIQHRFRIKKIRTVASDSLPAAGDVPGVATWQLVEALSLLAIVLRSQDAAANEIALFGRSGPIEIREADVVRYLWAQRTLVGDKSALCGRPDLIVTSSSEPPQPRNAIRIVEVKCVRQLDAQVIRSEFGKAHDLRVATYLIWSFYTPSPKVIAGAKGLGIDIEAIGFDTDRRNDLVGNPEALISRIAYTQEQVARQQRFATALETASQQTKNKLLALTGGTPLRIK